LFTGGRAGVVAETLSYLREIGIYLRDFHRFSTAYGYWYCDFKPLQPPSPRRHFSAWSGAHSPHPFLGINGTPSSALKAPHHRLKVRLHLTPSPPQGTLEMSRVQRDMRCGRALPYVLLSLTQAPLRLRKRLDRHRRQTRENPENRVPAPCDPLRSSGPLCPEDFRGYCARYGGGWGSGCGVKRPAGSLSPSMSLDGAVEGGAPG
jgi:hypothetical protein